MGVERVGRVRATDFDERVRAVLLADGQTAAAGLIIRELGAELLGYLWVAARSWGDGDDLFSEVCERIWRGLPGFRFDSSVRTWAHAVARNRVRDGYARARRHANTAPMELSDEVAEVRSTTIECLKPETRQRLEQLRQLLDEDDRTLLLLRVDRQMAWLDIARVMVDGEEPLDRTAARLRKRFERVKQRLRSELVSGDHGA